MTEPQSSERQDSGAATPGGDDARQKLVARLFQEHNDALLRFLAVRLHSHQEAKEVAQRMNLSERMVRDYVVRAIVYCRVGLDQEFPHG